MASQPSDFASLARQVASLNTQMQGLVRAREAPKRGRDVKNAVIADGACPAPLRACDPAAMAKQGRTCPDLSTYAPNPLIVDVDGNVCYAPEDLERAVGTKSLADTDTLIEGASRKLLEFLADKKYLNAIIAKARDANIMGVTAPRLVKEDACKPRGDDACDWSAAPLVVKEMDPSNLDTGLAEAITLYRTPDGARNSISDMMGTNYDYVFTAWAEPWGTSLVTKLVRAAAPVVVDEKVSPYEKARNPATLAYAGAYAWGVRADALAVRLGGEYRPVYLDRVRRLPAIIRDVNQAIIDAKLPDGRKFTSVYTSLANLTFDVAWPMLMERRIGLKGVLEAAKRVGVLRDGLDKTVDDAALAAMKPQAQWDLIVRNYLKATAS